ncbi:MAG: NifU family protein [Actinomycetia bacterium]|nr:NifU family protein [Actinomycetes bacterium]
MERVSDPAGPNDSSDSLSTRVQATLDVIRPVIQADNGDIMLRSVNEESGLVEVELMGACVTCPASNQTLKAGVERILKDRVEGVTEVVNVGVVTEEDIGGTAVSL